MADDVRPKPPRITNAVDIDLPWRERCVIIQWERHPEDSIERLTSSLERFHIALIAASEEE